MSDLDQHGFAVTAQPLIDAAQRIEFQQTYDNDALFRSTIDLQRHRFGQGQYRYYTNPLPEKIKELREAAYPELAQLANEWAERLGDEPLYPPTLAAFTKMCARAGQTRPTPLILRYQAGGWNALHQDIYGAVFFPFQMAILLSERDADYQGGESLFVEQRPRQQSRGHSVSIPAGHAVVFPTRYRPVEGSRGYYRATVRHGVSTITGGVRYTLGIIFHDAE